MVKVSAPANIALIKYMGKVDVNENLPANPSLSFSLQHLKSYVLIQEEPSSDKDQLNSFSEPELFVDLSDKAIQRFLNAFKVLKNIFELSGFYKICSGNNFPSDAGMASSASSFAALTLAVYNFCEKNFGKDYCLSRLNLSEDASENQVLERLSQISREFSGSSCRSFFSGWSIWQDKGAQSIDLGYDDLKFLSVVVDSDKKQISSSEAHQRVLQSKLFIGRSERAQTRCQELVKALRAKDWKTSFEITWAEFWDMHSLFETSQPSFGYIKPESILVLNLVKEYWMTHGDGPLCTMDAGPNVHLLFRCDQIDARNFFQTKLAQKFTLLGDL